MARSFLAVEKILEGCFDAGEQIEQGGADVADNLLLIFNR